LSFSCAASAYSYPAHNEEHYFFDPTIFVLRPFTAKVVVVNDNSTDKTAEIVLAFAKDNPFISFSRKDFKCNPFTW
jgi:glycosyltransferase involved in cell wall biosynthesis